MKASDRAKLGICTAQALARYECTLFLHVRDFVFPSRAKKEHLVKATSKASKCHHCPRSRTLLLVGGRGWQVEITEPTRFVVRGKMCRASGFENHVPRIQLYYFVRMNCSSCFVTGGVSTPLHLLEGVVCRTTSHDCRPLGLPCFKHSCSLSGPLLVLLLWPIERYSPFAYV